MFGDSGHGIILTLFSGFMILKEKQYLKTKIKNEVSIIKIFFVAVVAVANTRKNFFIFF